MEILPSILIFVLLFGLSAFFSGSELALMSLPAHKIESFIKQNKFGAKVLKQIKNNNERLLITILIGNNLVNVLTASLATKISMDIATQMGADQNVAIGISTGVITLFLLLFGEIFPKTLATRYADKIALHVAKIYQILGYILYPIVIVIEKLMQLLHKSNDETVITDEEIKSFIELGKKHGVFEKGEYEKIKKMLDFYEIDTEEIMTPRVKIDALPNNITVKEALSRALQFSHSRLPVYEEKIDNCMWTITLRELISYNQKDPYKLLSELTLSEIMKVPLITPIHKVLEFFRKRRSHIAIVIDEYGGVAGLITLEDIMEEVFGDFQDETDKEKAPIQKKGQYLLVQAHERIENVLEEIQLELDDIGFDHNEYGGETIGYVLMSHLGRLPFKHEKIILDINKEDYDFKTLEIEVLNIQKNTISELKLRLGK